MRRLLAVGLVLVVLLGTVPVSGVATQDRDGSPYMITSVEDFDSIDMRITVHENGSAEWTFTYTRSLETEEERNQFEEFANNFNQNETNLYTDTKQSARHLTETGQRETGRDMTAINFQKEAYIGGPQDPTRNRGTVEMSFTWTNFAKTEGDAVIVGDVFRGGIYVSNGQSLIIEAGDGLMFSDVKPQPDDMTDDSIPASDSVTWHGQQEFPDQQPRVELVSEDAQGSGWFGSGTNSGFDIPWTMTMAGILLLALGIGGVVMLRRADGLDFTHLFNRTASATGTDTRSADSRGGNVEPAVSDEELLTDEARVKKLLTENGGRMKQVNIVEETGWSKSKVSMLLSDMADGGDISKLRVGRENIISLDGHEPDAARSPHQEGTNQ